MLHRIRTNHFMFILLAVASVCSEPISAIAAEDALPRRAFMGAQLASVPDSVRAKYRLDANEGVLVLRVFPNSSAEKSGVIANDILLRLAQQTVGSPAAVINLLAQHKVGDKLALEYLREGKRRKLTLTLVEYPREKYEGTEVRYDHVTAPTGTLRSIITKPQNLNGRIPAVFIIQGYDCSSIDQPFAPAGAYAQLVRHFSEIGFATYRVEKSGVGDSKGEPCVELGFNADTQGFLAGLRRLKQYDFVDAERVYILGLSMGGVWAPMLAAQDAVKGIIAYGAIGKPWVEYMMENDRRQATLRGREAAFIEGDLKHSAAFWHYLLVEKLTPDEILAQHPELKAIIFEMKSTPDTVNIRHFFGRHYRFIQELNEVNIAERWQNVRAEVLAIWGKGDYVASRGDVQLIADIVNHSQPGKAQYIEVEADHWFLRASNFNESFARRRSNQSGEINPEIFEVMKRWLEGKEKIQ